MRLILRVILSYKMVASNNYQLTTCTPKRIIHLRSTSISKRWIRKTSLWSNKLMTLFSILLSIRMTLKSEASETCTNRTRPCQCLLWCPHQIIQLAVVLVSNTVSITRWMHEGQALRDMCFLMLIYLLVLAKLRIQWSALSRKPRQAIDIPRRMGREVWLIWATLIVRSFKRNRRAYLKCQPASCQWLAKRIWLLEALRILFTCWLEQILKNCTISPPWTIISISLVTLSPFLKSHLRKTQRRELHMHTAQSKQYIMAKETLATL